ncbi:hypothetical protein CKQ90_10755 [Klebsiella pneumoniae]|nr:hypothetical protein CKQ90_10755 [Klebsiella pneumoniae]
MKGVVGGLILERDGLPGNWVTRKQQSFSLGLSMGLKGSDFLSSLQTSWGKLQAQKSPQGLRRAGFQDFIG